jgi:hypothetical protein
MSHSHQVAVACVDHPELPVTRVCVACGRGFCDYCGDTPLVIRKKTARPPVVCRHCTDKVRPWVWNPFAFGLDPEPGEHLHQAMWAPRTAMMRAGYGQIPVGTLAFLIWLGCLGAAWAGVNLGIGQDPEVVAFARFGYGIAWSLAGVAALLTYATCLHALQPGGPGRAATLAQTLQVVVTAFAGPGVVAFVAGFTGFLAATLWHTEIGLAVCAAACVLAAGWGAVLAGWGLAVRRGASPVLGVASAIGATFFLAILVALVIWILAHPPWKTGWENTSFQ